MEITGSDILTREGFVSYNMSFLEILQALGVFGVIGLMFLLGVKLMALAPTEARSLKNLS